MQQSERPQFVALMTDALAFYRQDVSTFALGVWWQACAPFDLEQVSKALTAHALDPERGQFAPKPADLVRLLHGTQADRSLIAWGKVIDAIQRVGAYQSVVFDDPAIHAAIVDMGGWPAICRSEIDELPFVHRRFTDLHRTYSTRPDTAYTSRLLGEHEVGNAIAGREVAPPVLVGDPEAAKRVALRGGQGRVQITDLSNVLPRRIGRAA